MNALRRLRFNANVSVEELSAKTGVPTTTIYNLERGDIQHPRLTTIQPLAKFFKVPAGDLAASLSEAVGASESSAA